MVMISSYFRSNMERFTLNMNSEEVREGFHFVDNTNFLSQDPFR